MPIMLPNFSVWAQGPAPATLDQLEGIFTNIVQIIITIAGFALFIMLIVGGFRFLTSGGDTKAVAAARNTLTFAILGLVLIIASILILKLIEEITGVQVTIFKIKLPD
jgi:hypothetical protein